MNEKGLPEYLQFAIDNPHAGKNLKGSYGERDRSTVKNVRVRILASVWDSLKLEYHTYSNQETFEAIVHDVTRWDHKTKKLDGTTIEIEEDEMGRKSIDDELKKRSYSVSMTLTEKDEIQGKFESLNKAVFFLDDLMKTAYSMGLIPDELIEEKMEKYL